MFARLATAFSREGGDSKGLGATNENESPGQRDAANVPNVEYTLTEAFPPLQSDTAIEQQTTACTTDPDQAILPPKANTVNDGACSKGASSNPSTPPPSSPILKAQQHQQQYSADNKSQQQHQQQHKPAPLLHLHLPLQPQPRHPPPALTRRPAPDAREAPCRTGHNPKCMQPESPVPPHFRALRSAKRRPTL
ncbi:hypothetical protein PG993_001736 [Apiospora rasikravindrae]|uniref:Uncharacterized protein n=1 Tax=Apiospora rasikravindrae TaxID=990691 RepID=A0ABR1UF52_9PEZI